MECSSALLSPVRMPMYTMETVTVSLISTVFVETIRSWEQIDNKVNRNKGGLQESAFRIYWTCLTT